MRKSSSMTVAALADFMSSKAVAVDVQAKGLYVMKPVKLPDWREHVRHDGLTYRDEPSLMGSVRKLPNGEVV